MTLIIGAFVISLFTTLFYLEDRDGVSIYDPSSIHLNNKNK